VRADKRKLIGPSPVGQRDSNFRCCCQTGRHSWDDLHLNPCVAQHINFFCGASEDRRITTLQTHNNFSRRRKPHQQVVDLVLGDVLPSAALANVQDLRPRRNQRQDFRRNQSVMQNDVCRTERASCL